MTNPRGVKQNGWKTNKQVYVYAIKNEEGSIVYIGKGSGRRFEVQKKNFKLSGEILETFATEKLAYAKRWNSSHCISQA